MDQRKPNELEIEVDSLLGSLGLDVSQAKSIHHTGISYRAVFNGAILLYISIPESVPNTYSHIIRIEAEIGEFSEVDAGRIVYGIALYLNTHDCSPLRGVPRVTSDQKVKVLLQMVGTADLFQLGFLAQTILHCCELAEFFRNEMVLDGQEKRPPKLKISIG